MLTGFTFCIPIKNKSAEEVVTAWRNHHFISIWCLQEIDSPIMELNFKNQLFNSVAEQLSVERKNLHTHHIDPNQMDALRLS